MKTLQELQKQVHETAISKGWHEGDELGPDGKPTARQKLAWIALITDELDEYQAEDKPFYEGHNGKPEGELVEIADAIIRLFDMAGACGVDIVGNLLDEDVFEESISCARTLLVAAIRTGSEDQTRWMCTLFLALSGAYNDAVSDAAENEEGEKFPSLEETIELKDTYNRTRSRRHGGKLA